MEEKGQTYFTADTHFGHEKIIGYTNRPFKDAKEMDYILLKNLSIVQPEDTLYFIGDFSMKNEDHHKWFEKTLKRIPGKKILILGNHDKLNPFRYVELGFYSVHTSLAVGNYFLAHDPAVRAAIPSEYVMLCGHVHELFKSIRDNQGRVAINVGVDIWDFKPVSLNQIEELLKE